MSYTPAYLFNASDDSHGLTVHARPTWYLAPDHPLSALALTNVTGVAVSPDGARVAVVRSYPRSLAVYEIATGTQLFSVAVASSPYYGVDWSPDGTLIVVPTGGSPYVSLYNAATGAVIAGLPTFTQSCYSAAFSPDGSYLALGFYSSPRLSVLNVDTKSLVGGVAATSPVYSLAWSPDGALLAAAGQGRQVFSTGTWGTLTAGALGSSDSLVTGAVFSADSKKLLMARSNGTPKLRLYDTDSWGETAGVDLSALTTACRLPVRSPDGALIAIPLATSGTAFVYTNDWTVNPSAIDPVFSASSAVPVCAFGGVYSAPAPPPFWTRISRAVEVP